MNSNRGKNSSKLVEVLLLTSLTLFKNTKELHLKIREHLYSHMGCKGSHYRGFFVMRFQPSTPGEIISFNLKAGYGAMDSEADFIETSPGVHKYGRYEVGGVTTCTRTEPRLTGL